MLESRIEARAREDPRTLPIQPVPVRTRVVYLRAFGRFVTAIMRHWRPGDAQRCQLCPHCKAYDDGCLMIFPRRIPKAEAPLASSWEYAQPAAPVGVPAAKVVS